MSMDTKGGRVTIDFDGRIYSTRGSAKIDPSTVEMNNDANQDGTGYSTVKAKLAMIDVSFDRGIGLKWDSAMLLKKVNVTFVETDAGMTHLFTSARWQGFPQLDTATGEVTGLKVATDQYQSY